MERWQERRKIYPALDSYRANGKKKQYLPYGGRDNPLNLAGKQEENYSCFSLSIS